MADRVPDGSGFMHNGQFWPRGTGHTKADKADPCYLCGWGPTRAIHHVPAGTEPHGSLGMHSYRVRGPQLEQPAVSWVCPWDCCTHDQAQACRLVRSRAGCGGRFSPNTTPEQARKMIASPLPAGAKTEEAR